MKSEAASADLAIQSLVRQGAALLIRQDPTPVPITWWRRVRPGRHFYFTTGNDTFASHVLDFEREKVLYDGDAVEFRDKAGALVAYLAPVAEQETDPEAAKTMAASIQAWKDTFAQDQRLRAFVLEEYKTRGPFK